LGTINLGTLIIVIVSWWDECQILRIYDITSMVLTMMGTRNNICCRLIGKDIFLGASLAITNALADFLMT